MRPGTRCPQGTAATLPATYAAITTNLAGSNNDITYTANATGYDSNYIYVTYMYSAGANLSLTVTVPDANHIVCNLATDGDMVVTTVASDIVAAVNIEPSASAYVTATLAQALGTGLVTAMADLYLTGGAPESEVIVSNTRRRHKLI
jgi:hypothetical protein